jgi:uncharacterized repeat protein (TIGR03803 family)
VERVLHSFTGADGADPQASLLDVAGTLYGTTYDGGAYGGGTVFSITTTGKERVLHSFGHGRDGAYPLASLIEANGTLYGTTFYGGASRHGTVFSLSTDGEESVLHSFGSTYTDGSLPASNLIDVDGTFYGTTVDGGGLHACLNFGCGTVYSISSTGSERVVYSFSKAGSSGSAARRRKSPGGFDRGARDALWYDGSWRPAQWWRYLQPKQKRRITGAARFRSERRRRLLLGEFDRRERYAVRHNDLRRYIQ